MNNTESYPPVLCHPSHQHHQPPTLDPDDTGDPIHDPDLVPVIDLQCLDHDKNKLEEACKDWGLFRLLNHGVPLTLLKQLHDEAKRLFSVPFESKHASCSDSPVTYFWGSPTLTPSRTINWVEGFDVPLSQLSQFQPQLPTLESIR